MYLNESSWTCLYIYAQEKRQQVMAQLIGEKCPQGKNFVAITGSAEY